ncbi:RNA ligase [Sciscionella marina]|uniref:RNA ligase n=1 Tax=Sciscionella marina TaxID=508770 RepID=UPI0003727044|nr:RNA ligase [Sciscionella marina]
MTQLDELLNTRVLAEEIENKFVRAQYHPILPYVIYSYTEKAQANAAWTEVTRQCRGLVADFEGRVIARPFPKFFNYGEQKRLQHWTSDEPVTVTDKVDGSLGIVYTDRDGLPQVATRGSFTSEQAAHATHTLRAKYPDWRPPTGFTVLVEIVYPENRIVVDYGATDDLVLLGCVDIHNGCTHGPGWLTDWPGPRAEVFPYRSLPGALAAKDRPGREGMVVHFLVSDDRVKIKQDNYVALHRIVTGLNEQVVWEHLTEHGNVDELVKGLPEEFEPWVRDVADRLATEFEQMETVAAQRFRAERKRFAFEIKDEPDWLKACLFKQLDAKDYAELIWKQLKPKADTPPHKQKENA